MQLQFAKHLPDGASSLMPPPLPIGAPSSIGPPISADIAPLVAHLGNGGLKRPREEGSHKDAPVSKKPAPAEGGDVAEYGENGEVTRLPVCGQLLCACLCGNLLRGSIG